MNKSLVDLAKQFKALKTTVDEVKATLNAANADWDACEQELLEAMVQEGVNSVKLDGIGNFIMTTKNYLSVTAVNKPGFLDYLRESGNGGLIKEDVNSATLTSFLSDHFEQLVRDRVNSGLDEVDARKNVLEMLNKRGASYHTKRVIALRAK